VALDPSWLELLDHDVILKTKGGGAFKGRVLAIEAEALTLQLGGDLTRVIALEDIDSVTTQSVPPPVVAAPSDSQPTDSSRVAPTGEPRIGLATLISGSLATTAGLIETITGAAFIGPPDGDTTLNLTLVIVGPMQIAAGVPLLIVGAIRHARYRAWHRGHPTSRLMPSAGRTAAGTWTTGFQLRF
jgi:hypothetical protein